MDITIAKFILKGPPVAKARPRFRANHKPYDPQSAISQRIKWEIKSQWEQEPLETALEVTMVFLMPYPKSWSKKKKENYKNIPHITKSDLDNMIKQYLDCMNGIVYRDDSLVTSIVATKMYCDHEGETQIEVIQRI